MNCMNLCNCVIQGKAIATLDGVQYGEKMLGRIVPGTRGHLGAIA